MTEQSIRDEIARELYGTDGRYSWTWNELVDGWARGQENGLDPNYPHLVKTFREKADLILTSPVIRRIQAEAWDAGAKWAAVECGTLGSEDQAFLVPADNPYRKEQP